MEHYEGEQIEINFMIEHFELSETDINQQISDCDVEEISNSFCEKWRSLPPYLEMETIVAKDIDRDHSGCDECEKRCSLLKKWKKLKGQKATYKCLISALLRMKCRDEAEGVCRLLKKHNISALSCGNSQTADSSLTVSIKKTPDTKVHASSSESASNPSVILTPEVRADLQLQLEVNLEQIMRRYLSFVNCVRMSIIEKGISAGDLCAYLLALPAFNPDHGELKFTLLSEVSSHLEKATTINQIFNVLNKMYATFLNYEIFQSMVDDFNIDQNQEKLKYPEHLDAYIKMHKLSEFEDVNPLLKKIECGSKTIILKFDIDMTCKLAKIQDLTKAVAKILGLRPSALRLLHIEEGCVVVTLLIPAPVADFIFSSDKAFTTEEVKEIHALSMLRLECNGNEYEFLQNDQNHKEEVLAENAAIANKSTHGTMLHSGDQAGRTPLHTAAKFGELEVVKRLLFTDEVPIFTLNLEPGRQLSDALKLISQRKLSERHRDFSGNTPVHTACVHGQLDVVKLLTCEIGCDPNNTNNEGLSCLHLAAQHGHLPLVRYLVEQVGSDVTLEDDHGRSSTYLAARQGHLDILKYLIKEVGADPHFRTAVEWKSSDFTKAPGRSLLHTASSKGHYNVVRYLVEQCGLDPSCEDEAGVSPLHLACGRSIDVVSYLIAQQNCNPHHPDGEGTTCLHYACLEGHLDVVRYLINTHHCDPKVEADLGRTPFHFATMGGNLAVIKFLIEDLMCDYRSPDSEGCVPLHYACLRGHLDVVKYLVNCDPQAKAKLNTSLMFAAFNGHMDVVKFLIEDMKCDPNVADEYSEIPLHDASRKGHLDIVKYLVEICHCDPLHRDSIGVTPLHVAASNGHTHIVRYYISTHHCDPRVKTKHHFTPLDYAAKYGDEVTVKYLLDSYHCDVRLKNTDILRAKLWADQHCVLSYLHSLTSQGVSQEINLFQNDADILSQMSGSVRMVQCARDVMDLIAEIGNSLEYPDTILSKVQEIGNLIDVLAMATEGVDITKVTAVSKQLSLVAEFQLRECAEYPDLWPLAVDELLRVIADLAESVRDFIGAIESSNPSHQCPPQPQPVPMPESVSSVSEIPEASASALPPYLNPMAKHSTPQQNQGHRFFRKHLDEVRDTLYEKDD